MELLPFSIHYICRGELCSPASSIGQPQGLSLHPRTRRGDPCGRPYTPIGQPQGLSLHLRTRRGDPCGRPHTSFGHPQGLSLHPHTRRGELCSPASSPIPAILSRHNRSASPPPSHTSGHLPLLRGGYAKRKSRTLSCAAFGAAKQIRTADLVITNDVLYHLSYSSIFYAADFHLRHKWRP